MAQKVRRFGSYFYCDDEGHQYFAVSEFLVRNRFPVDRWHVLALVAEIEFHMPGIRILEEWDCELTEEVEPTASRVM